MMSDYDDLTLAQYRDALASSNPTPGGGTAAAVALSQGAALAVMVCDLTLGKDKWEGGWIAADATKTVALRLMEEGHALAQRDAASFDDVMAAYKLSRNSDEETEVRRLTIEEATIVAAQVPMETARAALGLLALLPQLAESGNGNAVTDVGVAGLLVSASCKGALFNVEINASSLPDEISNQLMREVGEIRGQAKELSRAIMNAVNVRLNS